MSRTARVKPPLKYHEFDWAPGYRVSDTGIAQTNWGLRGGGFAGKPEWYHRDAWRNLKPDLASRGRPRVTLRINGVSKRFFVSHLVLMAFVGPRPDGYEACHYPDPDVGNCNESNLRWDTHQGNIDDKAKLGTNPNGERIHTAKLTADDVREIRLIGHPLKRHAMKFRVSESLVSAILKRKVWAHV